jgi:Tol biopolymer transport system component
LRTTTAVLALLLGCAPGDAVPPKTAAEPGKAEPPAPSTASEAPETDIYLAELDLTSTPPQLNGLRNLTHRAGYDNQPYFVEGDDRLLYTSVRDGQADIYSLSLADNGGGSSLVHGSPANEYSPTLMPGRRAISMIREDKGVQKLWHYATDGNDLGPLLPDVVDVGYHAWLSADDVALFILDSEHDDNPQHRLEVMHIPDGTRRVIAKGIGRCLAVFPRSSLASGSMTFVHLGADAEPSTILQYDLASDSTKKLLKTRPGSEDYAWAPDGSLLMAEGTVLHRWTSDTGWQRVADLAAKGIEHITRLAVSGDGKRVALVVGKEPKAD